MTSTTMTLDHRSGLRRRGQALERAIYDSVLAELAAHGLAKLSIERVAERAGTGKSAIYRRWPSRDDLLVAAFRHSMPDFESFQTTGDLRADLLAFLRQAKVMLSGPYGLTMRAVIGDVRQDPALTAALREKVLGTRTRQLYDILAAGVDRGQVRPDALVPECLETGPALLRHHFLVSGEIDDRVIVRIVDNVLLPMFRPLPRAQQKADESR